MTQKVESVSQKIYIILAIKQHALIYPVSRLTTIAVCLFKAIFHYPQNKKTECEVSQFDF